MSKVDNSNINNNYINVGLNVTDIPVISNTSVNIFRTLGADTPVISDTSMDIFKTLLGTDSPVKLTRNLQAKATTLNSSIQKLQEAKSEDTRNKILTTLRSALTVAVLVGGILGTTALLWCLPAAAIGIPAVATAVVGVSFVTFLAYGALCYYNACRIGINNDEYAGLFILLGGPFLPLYEGFGKISRLENQVQTQKKEIEANLIDLISFFGHDRSNLQETLTKEIDILKASLEWLERLPFSRTEADEKEIQEKLKNHEKALSELTKAKSFYHQFQGGAMRVS